MKIIRIVFPITFALFLLTACGSSVSEPVTVSSTVVPAIAVPATVAGPSPTSDAETASTPSPHADALPSVQSEEQVVLSSFSQPVTASGELLVLYGHVMDRNGQPFSGYAVEIWQVDAEGVYDHPGDSNTARRDMGFQFYGTSVTDKNGLFAFRTIVPARYEPRPRHIHFKVKKDGQTVLTSQFYFSGDVSIDEMLLLDLTDAQDANGNAVMLAFKDIVVNTGSGGDLILTPTQVEGPYYPVVDVSQFDNDLASVQ